jgi:hypothetical protein
MTTKQSPALPLSLLFPHWHDESEAVLRETDHKMLFKRVEIAEAALFSRRDALRQQTAGTVEQSAIEKALKRCAR